MTEALPRADSNFWARVRLKSYTHWPYRSPDLRCNPEQMAAAGFICIGNAEEPDLVECFICSKQLDGWDATDDPWQEHFKHQNNCPYIKLNKKNEEMWTIEELYSMVKQYYIKEYTRTKETTIINLKKELSDLALEIPIIYRNSHKNKKSLK